MRPATYFPLQGAVALWEFTGSAAIPVVDLGGQGNALVTAGADPTPGADGHAFTAASSHRLGNAATSYRAKNKLADLSSENFTASAALWDTVLNTTVTVNQAADPVWGLTTADDVNFTDADSYHLQTYDTGAALLGTTYTFSVWVKKPDGGKATIGVRIVNNSDAADSTFTLVTLTSEWQRIAVTRTFTGVGNQLWVGFDNRVASGGDGLTGSILAWGAQVELGPHATEYQPSVLGNLFFDASHPHTIVVLSKTTTTAATQVALARASGTAAQRNFRADVVATSGNCNITLRGTANGPIIVNGAIWQAIVYQNHIAGATNVARAYVMHTNRSVALTIGSAAEETAQNIIVGASVTATPANFWNGKIAFIGVWNRYLSGTELRRLYLLLARRYAQYGIQMGG